MIGFCVGKNGVRGPRLARMEEDRWAAAVARFLSSAAIL
jgi:hypothetical protein